MILKRFILTAAAAAALSVTELNAGGLKNLTVEYEKTPMGIDTGRPRFSWQMETDGKRRGQMQKTYRLTVTDENGNVVWNSGVTRSSKSVNIIYAGAGLKPMCRYKWSVDVTDERRNRLTAQSWFETGLCSTGTDAWNGARWIGLPAEALPLHSHTLAVYKVKFALRLNAANRSTRAAFIFGANDERLMNPDMNIYNISSAKDSSFIKVEIDTRGLDGGKPATLNVYRRGYCTADIEKTVRLKSFDIPKEIVNRGNRYDEHRVMIAVNLGITDIYVDNMLKPVAHIGLNPEGQGGDFIAFPVLCDVGFSVEKGQRASLSDVEIINYRTPSNRILTVDSLRLTATGRFTKIINPSRGSMPMLRRSFSVDKPVTSARLYVTARGVYDFYINGRRTCDDYFNPGFTQYNKTQLYRTFDVTSSIVTGENAMGAVLGEGWWSGQATFQGENWNYFGDRQSLLAMLVLKFADGTVRNIVTDPAVWRCYADGPYITGSMFQGERYDARREKACNGWTEGGFDDSQWHAAAEIGTDSTTSSSTWGNAPAVNDFTACRLMPQHGSTVSAVKTLRAVAVDEVRPGVFVYDMGQNMSGVPSVKFMKLKPGQTVRMRFAEVRYPDLPEYGRNKGMIMLENIRAAMATDEYTAMGTGVETFSPRLTSHGYRYIEITGIDTPLPLENVESKVLSSVHEITSSFTSSDTLLNRLWQNIEWSARANLSAVPTDCPQRNERLGWSGDISIFANTATYIAQVPQFLRQHMLAMRDVQRSDGRMPDVAPLGGGFGGLLWGSAAITVPWECYRQYEDKRVLEDNYTAMKRYMNFVAAEYTDPESGIIVQKRQWGDLGDWLGLEDSKNDKPLLWECYYIHDLRLMSRMASVLGHSADAQHYAALAEKRKKLFLDTFLDSEGRTIASGFTPGRKGKLVDIQTSYALPLVFGIADGMQKEKLAENLANTVRRTNTMDNGTTAPPYSLMTGFIGTAWISKALSDNGMTDIAYRQLLNTQYPSWLYPVTQGATTIWERLNSYTKKDGFGGNNRMNSFNHYSFGAVGSWLINYCIGIRRDETEPGFSHFRLQPEIDPDGKLTSAHGHYDSMYGRIESGWTVRNGSTEYRFTVPANTTATVILPAASIKNISENGKIIDKRRYAPQTIKIGGKNAISFNITSGTYTFTVKGY